MNEKITQIEDVIRGYLGEEVSEEVIDSHETKPSGHWKSLENVLVETRRIICDHGIDSLPNSNVLMELGYSGLVNGIFKYHGGYRNIREHLGEEQKRLPHGYWNNLDNVLAKIREIMMENNLSHCPTMKFLSQLGQGGLNAAIQKKHGGIIEIRKLVGELKVKQGKKTSEVKEDGSIKKQTGYWTNLENCLSTAKEIMSEGNLECLPSKKDLGKIGYGGMATAIVKYHGGFTEFRKLLGESINEKTGDYWRNPDHIMEELQSIIEDKNLERLPNESELIDFGHGSLYYGIREYYGGMNKFKPFINEEVEKQPDKYTLLRRALEKSEDKTVRGHWQNLDNVVEEAKRIMIEHGLYSLPSARRLAGMGYSGFAAAVKKNHGGFRNLREILGEEQRKNRSGYWFDIENTKKEARKIIEENNLVCLPSVNRLREMGYQSLVLAVTKYHGGMNKFRNALGETEMKSEYGEWKDLEKTLRQAETILSENDLSQLPSQRKLREMGYVSFANSVANNHGGFPTFRMVLNKYMTRVSESNELECLLDDYISGGKENE